MSNVASSADDSSGVSSTEEKSSSIKTPNGMNNGEKELGDMEPIVLPFVKKSPFWKAFESMEVFKIVPQRPHFKPLLETSEIFREGSAIGMMVVFSDLVEMFNNLSLNYNPRSTMQSIKDGLLEVEKYGFDITIPLGRIIKLMSLKESHNQALDKIEEIEEKLDECLIRSIKYGEKSMELEADKHRSQTFYFYVVLEYLEQEFEDILKTPWKSPETSL